MRGPTQILLIFIFILLALSLPLILLDRLDDAEQPITFDNDDETVTLLVEIVTPNGVLKYDSSEPSYLALKLNNSFVSAINISVFIRPVFVGSPSSLRITQGSLIIESVSPARNIFIIHDFSINPVVIDTPASSQQYMVGEWSISALQIESTLGLLPDNTPIEILASINMDISLEFLDPATGNSVYKSRTVTASALIRLTYSVGDLLGVDVSFGV